MYQKTIERLKNLKKPAEISWYLLARFIWGTCIFLIARDTFWAFSPKIGIMELMAAAIFLVPDLIWVLFGGKKRWKKLLSLILGLMVAIFDYFTVSDVFSTADKIGLASIHFLTLPVILYALLIFIFKNSKE